MNVMTSRLVGSADDLEPGRGTKPSKLPVGSASGDGMSADYGVRLGETARVMIWKNGQPRQVELRWGLRPIESGGRPVTLVRAEGQIITNRCLIIVNEIYLRRSSASNNKRRRVALITQTPFFCIAGMWCPETRGGWPAAFAGITVKAYPDISPFQDRHMAVVHEDDWRDWLEGSRSAESILRPFPSGSFEVW